MEVIGGRPLKGRVRASGAKNAALPLMAAAILADSPMRLRNVPDLRDVRTMATLLGKLGVRAEREAGGDLVLETVDEGPVRAPYDIMKTMRAGICVLGPLVAKRRRACVSLPGGCVIGDRPVNLHLRGLRALGAGIRVEHGYILGDASGEVGPVEMRADGPVFARPRPAGPCPRLRGSEMYLGGPFGSTVTGTENILMAAALAEGRTIIDGAACEPEVQDLAHVLVKMGARIEGIGSPRLLVEGVERLRGVDHAIPPDRIEAGTYLIAAAATGGDVTVEGARWDHLFSVLALLEETGAAVERAEGGIRVRGGGRPACADVTTLPFPGFPTDLQAQMMACLARADGNSIIIEKIYPDRFMHVAELGRMRADIRKEGNVALVHGVERLSGAEVMASDLRASAALVVAGLVAEGKTTIRRIYHLDRGYEGLDRKLAALGADVRRLKDEEEP
jgi:UDP-N-acetylglucosamine 1-carboxyvinyltransferase